MVCVPTHTQTRRSSVRHLNVSSQSRQIDSLRRQFAQVDGLPFAEVLSAETVEKALIAEKVSWREKVLTPVRTLWAFLSQVLDRDGSCRAAVARLIVWLLARGEKPCSPETDPYCKARQRLPEGLMRRLTRDTGQELSGKALSEWRWKGRRVKVADGSTISMPDTAKNQEAYPQNPSQKKGIGFPIARIVVVFCLACGAALDAALGRYQGKRTGENALLRSVHDAFEEGDIMLADRYYSGYCDIALFVQKGVDVVVRKHQLRRSDFRTGQHLGPYDHVIVWTKPKQRPEWMDEDTYQGLPETLTLREVRVRVTTPGFRTKVLDVVTTLIDPDDVSRADIAGLYRMRWHAELDLRSLKITLGMDVLRCKSPEMIRNEFWTHLLAYNLIRTVMAQAAGELGLLPREISFTATVQALRAFGVWLEMASTKDLGWLIEFLWLFIATHQVMNRPDRIEPRARKRRPKDYPHLQKPRAAARTFRYAKS
jgi:IS4 transposase